MIEQALIKGWAKYDKLKLKAAKLHATTKAGHEIDLVKGDILGLRLSSNGKLTRMITEKYGPNHPVEVHLFLVPGGRHRDFTPELIADLNAGMFPEKLSSIIYKGPYFKVMT